MQANPLQRAQRTSLGNTGMRKDGKSVFLCRSAILRQEAAKNAKEAVPSPRTAARNAGIWQKTDKKVELFALDFVYSGSLTEWPENHILPVAQTNT